MMLIRYPIVLLVCLGSALVIGFPYRSFAGAVTDAAVSGDVTEIERLIDEGADVNEDGIAGPLYFAIQRGHVEAALLLINRGANVNQQSKFGTPLHIAARKGHTAIVRTLLQRGADLTSTGNEDETTPLHEAALGGSAEAALVLLEHGADVNAPMRYQAPPIHFAKKRGHENVVTLLRSHGASPPLVEPIARFLADADLEKGRLRAIECQHCHTLGRGEGSVGGPPLWNIVGRERASEKFLYSEAMAALDGKWDFEQLNRFLALPTSSVPGTQMEIGFEPNHRIRIDLIAYLRTLSDDPVPLP